MYSSLKLYFIFDATYAVSLNGQHLCRSDDEVHMDSCDYFSRRRAEMQKDGFRITGVISSHFDALTGPYLGKHVFKLPNAIYYDFEHQIESTYIPKK